MLEEEIEALLALGKVWMHMFGNTVGARCKDKGLREVAIAAAGCNEGAKRLALLFEL
jgi:hypothetical protein